MSVGYLLASLPMLFPERAPSITIEQFCASCSVLSGADAKAAILLATGSTEESSHPAVQHWRDLEAAIDGAIGQKRLARRGGATVAVQAPSTKLAPVWLMRMVDSAFETATNPLMREQLLAKVRWAAADDMGGFDPLTKHQVFAYAVKLRLAVRQAAWDRARGEERLEAALPKQTL